jgi:hypothetical protein
MTQSSTLKRTGVVSAACFTVAIALVGAGLGRADSTPVGRLPAGPVTAR